MLTIQRADAVWEVSRLKFDARRCRAGHDRFGLSILNHAGRRPESINVVAALSKTRRSTPFWEKPQPQTRING
jgi:hypothetical protein